MRVRCLCEAWKEGAVSLYNLEFQFPMLLIDLIYYLVDFVVKIYYHICCLIFRVQIESSDLFT